MARKRRKQSKKQAQEQPRQTLPGALRALVAEQPELAEVKGALAHVGRIACEGLPAGARAAFLAALAEERPLLIVVHEAERKQDVADDLELLLEGRRGVIEAPPLSLGHGAEPGSDPSAPFAVEWGARLRVLRALREDLPPVVVASASSLLQRLPSPERADEAGLVLCRGSRLDPHELALSLVGCGYRRVPLVEVPGEFAIRGGIVDVFPVGAGLPLRAELFGDEVESLRTFEPHSQRSVEVRERYDLPLSPLGDVQRTARAEGATLLDHLPESYTVVVLDPARCGERLEQAARRFAQHAQDLHSPSLIARGLRAHPLLLAGRGASEHELAEGAQVVAFSFEPPALGGHDLVAVTNDLAHQVARGERLTVACVNEAERERLLQLFADCGLKAEAGDGLRRAPAPAGVSLVVTPLRAGLRAPSAGVWLVVSTHLFTRHLRRETTHRRVSSRNATQTAVESFADLELGQAVVHVSHGVALFQGIVRRDRDGQPRDFLKLEFDGGANLYIPTDRIGLVRRYVGPTSKQPRLSKLGGQGWQKKTKKAAEAVRDLAAELLEVQAERLVRSGHAFPPDDREQVLFNQSFGYTDTPDQETVTAEIQADMCAPRAMDRVVCGDVGYGKTELAIRAAFRCVMAGKQVAVLAPTTVLAHQHHRVFRERMASYPIRVEVVSRFCTPAQQREAVKGARDGVVDVLIGTHRILSRDVRFKDLGLVVVDEEQRFGVEHKERIKEFCRTVDLLTLTATPIPRTLHMALSGARDISVLQTPPPGRTAVESRVSRFDRGLIQRAIERELARDGQVFFVHDRVRSIERVATMVRELVPTARVLVVHGQLPEQQIEARMLSFFDHEVDVLVATTLIENGIDVRRANTLIVDRADRFGLAELHQIRGRVGRSSTHAYAHFLVDDGRILTDIAQRRLRAIQEFTELGAGFHIAMRDLEIRGAGNVLGAQQSGHIVNVGYDLYCRLLKRSMAELKGELQKKPLDMERDLDLEAGEVQVVLDVAAYVPDAYVADAALKIDCYRKLASADREEALEDLAAELRDRFGPLPKVLENLFTLRRVRLRAAGHGVLKITRQDRVLQLRCRSRERLEAAVRAHRDLLRPIDGRMLYVRMRDPKAPDEDQLTFLLDLLEPALPPEMAAPRAVDPQRLKRERQRRLRAKLARQRQQT